jgi:nitrate/nitrite-specific signal transduction histidine kinase
MAIDLKDNLEEAVDEIKSEVDEIREKLEAKYEDVEELLLEEKAKVEAEYMETLDDAKGFFEEHKVACFIAGGLLVAGAIILILL